MREVSPRTSSRCTENESVISKGRKNTSQEFRPLTFRSLYSGWGRDKMREVSPRTSSRCTENASSSWTSTKTAQLTKMTSHIKDYMDEICESQDYYRKHVANDGESLYRSISDSVFGSQNYKFIVAKAVELITNEA